MDKRLEIRFKNYKRKLRQYDEIVKLLLKGITGKEIAKRVNVSRETVCSVNSGKKTRPKPPLQELSDSEDDSFVVDEKILKRCPSCGAMISTKKCLACFLNGKEWK